MGREVRRVPADWTHPTDRRGRHIPLHEQSFLVAAQEWDANRDKWEEGFIRDWIDGGWKPRGESPMAMECETYSEWNNPRPVPEQYMPDFPVGTATHYMMYETTSEGTPISPAFATPEELARWLVDNEASAFADRTASYDGWLRVCQGGFAPSAVIDANGMRSGVDL